MTVIGSRRMIVYDDTEPLEKLKIYDARVEVPPHYDTFAEFTYSYHYGDAYIPYIKQDEPLKLECQHFLECVRTGMTPITDGRLGLEVVRILEASSESLKQHGSAVQTELAERRIKVPATNGEGKEHGNGSNGNGHSNGHGNGNGNGRGVVVPASAREMVSA
jgi:predicted dehydrogenase